MARPRKIKRTRTRRAKNTLGNWLKRDSSQFARILFRSSRDLFMYATSLLRRIYRVFCGLRMVSGRKSPELREIVPAMSMRKDKKRPAIRILPTFRKWGWWNFLLRLLVPNSHRACPRRQGQGARSPRDGGAGSYCSAWIC